MLKYWHAQLNLLNNGTRSWQWGHVIWTQFGRTQIHIKQIKILDNKTLKMYRFITSTLCPDSKSYWKNTKQTHHRWCISINWLNSNWMQVEQEITKPLQLPRCPLVTDVKSKKATIQLAGWCSEALRCLNQTACRNPNLSRLNDIGFFIVWKVINAMTFNVTQDWSLQSLACHWWCGAV